MAYVRAMCGTGSVVELEACFHAERGPWGLGARGGVRMDKRGRASRLDRVDLHFLAGFLFLLFLLVLGQQEVQEEGHDEPMA